MRNFIICIHQILTGSSERRWSMQQTWGGEIAYKHLFGKPARKRPLGRPRHIYKDNFKMNCNKMCEGMDWIQLPQDRNL
jgi:hypothetical protein